MSKTPGEGAAVDPARQIPEDFARLIAKLKRQSGHPIDGYLACLRQAVSEAFAIARNPTTQAPAPPKDPAEQQAYYSTLGALKLDDAIRAGQRKEEAETKFSLALVAVKDIPGYLRRDWRDRLKLLDAAHRKLLISIDPRNETKIEIIHEDAGTLNELVRDFWDKWLILRPAIGSGRNRRKRSSKIGAKMHDTNGQLFDKAISATEDQRTPTAHESDIPDEGWPTTLGKLIRWCSDEGVALLGENDNSGRDPRIPAETAPGIDQLPGLCKRLFRDSTLSLLNVCTLRAIICYSRNCLVRDTHHLSLIEAADACEEFLTGNDNIDARVIRDFIRNCSVSVVGGLPEPMGLIREFMFAQKGTVKKKMEEIKLKASDRTSWKKVAERLKRLQSQGEPFTNYDDLAETMSCSRATISKAINSEESLKVWAKRPVASPRAQSLEGWKKGEYVNVVADSTQSDESDPADEAAIREHLEKDLSPEDRAFFNGLSRKDQLYFLHDPDQHRRILGRKP